MGIHATSRAIAALNGRGVRGGVSELVKNPLDTAHRAVDVVDLDFDHARAVPVLDDLHMGQGSRNAVTHIGKAPAVALASRTLGLSENLWEQAGIAGFPVGEHDQLVPIGEALSRIFKQTPNERLIALSLHV